MAEKNKKTTTEATASYEKDSKRYRRYRIEENDADIIGTLYVSKEKKAPKKITITFTD